MQSIQMPSTTAAKRFMTGRATNPEEGCEVVKQSVRKKWESSRKAKNFERDLGRCCRPMLCVKTMCKQYKLATPPMSKVVFGKRRCLFQDASNQPSVCNVPYNMSETRSSMFSSRLVRSSVLSILSAPKMQHIPRAPPIRLVYDRDTGKPKGYGFCEFAGMSISFHF